MDRPQDANPTGGDARGTMNLAMLVIQAYAISVEVFLHRGFGERYLGSQAALVFLLVPFHAYLLRDYDPSQLFRFLGAYLIACVLQRIGIIQRRWKGVIRHSFYSGFPILATGNTRFDEPCFKIWIEPFLVMLAGAVLIALDRALGTFILAAGFALYIKGRMMNQLDRIKLLDMQDAMFDQMHRGSQVRAMNHDHRENSSHPIRR